MRLERLISLVILGQSGTISILALKNMFIMKFQKSIHSIPFRSLPKVKRNKMRHVPNESPIYGILTPRKNEIFLSPPLEINRVDPTKFWKLKNIFVDLYYFYTQKIPHQLFSQKFFIPWIWTQLSLMVGLRFLKFFDWEEEIG